MDVCGKIGVGRWLVGLPLSVEDSCPGDSDKLNDECGPGPEVFGY